MPILALAAVLGSSLQAPLPLPQAAASVAAAPSSAEPVRIFAEELYAHRLAGSSYVRISRADRDPHSVGLDLTVDEGGAVVSVAVVPDFQDEEPLPKRVTEPLFETARQWRFRPFVRGGRAVPVHGAVLFTIIPPVRRPAVHVPMPRAAAKDMAVTLVRDPCFGACPAYTVTVRGDGQVRFDGRGNVVVPGVRDYRIPAVRAEALIEQFRAADFWSLDEVYRASITDQPTQYLTVTVGRRSKSVEDYAGLRAGMPDVVIALEEAVDKAAGTERWVTGNAQTVDALAADGFDFTSREAADMAVAAAHEAPELTMALLDRGARFDVWPVCQGCTPTGHRFQLLSAAAARPGRLFDRLDTDAFFAGLDAQALRLLLNEAARGRSVHVVERLLARGADPRVVDAHQPMPLALALSRYNGLAPASEEQAILVRMLLAAGAPVDATGPDGMTALQYAADADPDALRLLLDAGADPDAQGGIGPPILYITASEDNALLLLAAGADRGLRDGQGRSLAEIAQERGWTRVEAMLVGGAATAR